MAYGQLVAFEYGWVGQTRRPAIDLEPYAAALFLRPALAAGARIAIGAGIGAAFGATTLYPALWLGVGALVGFAFSRLRDHHPEG
jgi:hypothetical protein